MTDAQVAVGRGWRELREPKVPDGLVRALVNVLAEPHDIDREPLALDDLPGDLVELAIDQRVTGALLAALRKRKDDSGLGCDRRLVAVARIDVMRHLRHLGVVRRLGAVLDAADIPWFTVKGPVLTELSYRSISRPYLDLDLVVPAQAFRPALTALAEAAVPVVDRNWDMALRGLNGQLHLHESSQDTSIDLHWHLVNRASLRNRWRLPMDDLFERVSTDASVGGPVLECTDRLIHYALHAAVSGGHRLVWIKDIERTIANDPPDWDALVERSRRWRVGLPVAAMLHRSRHTLGALVPPGVILDLAPAPLHRTLIRQFGTWRPSGTLPGGGSLDRVVARRLADDLLHTASGVAQEGNALLRRLRKGEAFWLDVSDPRNMAYASGGATAREIYLDRIAATGPFGHG